MDPGSHEFRCLYRSHPATEKSTTTIIMKGIRKASSLEIVAAPEIPKIVRTNGPMQQSEDITPAATPPATNNPELLSVCFIILPLHLMHRELGTRLLLTESHNRKSAHLMRI